MSFGRRRRPQRVAQLGRIFVALKPRAQRGQRRRRSSSSCGPSCRSVPGIKVYLQNIPTIRIGGQLTKSQYQYTLQGADTDELYQWAPQIEEKLAHAARLPGRDERPADHASRR